MKYLEVVSRAVREIREITGGKLRPQAGITLGTGLSDLSSKIEIIHRIPYGQIPGFLRSTVKTHAGELILGHMAGKPVAALAGRFHLYEGYTPLEVTLPVRVLAELGVEIFIFCNAAGGLDPKMRPGRVMLITDHLNFTGENPLIGPNVEAWGERFPEMSRAYDPKLMDLARRIAAEQGILMHEGVYVGLKGPSLETPAETRMLRGFGADAVGMSTVLEVIAARHHGLRVLGFSAISNVNIPEAMAPAPLKVIIKNASAAGQDLSRLISGVLQRI